MKEMQVRERREERGETMTEEKGGPGGEETDRHWTVAFFLVPQYYLHPPSRRCLSFQSMAIGFIELSRLSYELPGVDLEISMLPIDPLRALPCPNHQPYTWPIPAQ